MSINKATSGAIYARSTSTAMVAEAVTSSAGNIYQITDSAHRVIDPDVSVSLNTTASTYLDTTWMHGGWDYFLGRVKLTAATSPTITGSWLTMTSMGSVVSWSLSPTKNTQETTAIGDTWKSYTAIETGTTFNMNRYFVDTNFWGWIASGNTILIQIWENATTGFWLRGNISTFSTTMAVGKVTDESVTVQVSGPISYF